mmetsp:Transcript_37028/g.104465  ORF Transcript_37028/g.104465 Transcript_37028/m.104465 type:complete len:323 (+) Transcript_37028:297-1265(+)
MASSHSMMLGPRPFSAPPYGLALSQRSPWPPSTAAVSAPGTAAAGAPALPRPRPRDLVAGKVSVGIVTADASVCAAAVSLCAAAMRPARPRPRLLAGWGCSPCEEASAVSWAQACPRLPPTSGSVHCEPPQLSCAGPDAAAALALWPPHCALPPFGPSCSACVGAPLCGGAVPARYIPRRAPSCRRSPPHWSNSARSPSLSSAPLSPSAPASGDGSGSRSATLWKRPTRLSRRPSRVSGSSDVFWTPRILRLSRMKPPPPMPTVASTWSPASGLSSTSRASAVKASLLQVMFPMSSKMQTRTPVALRMRLNTGTTTSSSAST